ncbi:unnamed protein product [Diamesa serratosioi]
MSTTPKKFEYSSEAELVDDFKKIICIPENLEIGSNYLLETLIDEAILSIVFEEHFMQQHHKAINGDSETKKDDSQNGIFFQIPTACQQDQTVKCPICQQFVSAKRFAPHLERCMGMGRNSSRIASQRIKKSRDTTNTSYYNDTNDNDTDEDADWNMRAEKGRKKPQAGKNGPKGKGKNI